VNGYLIDTNVISEVVRKSPDKGVLNWLSGTTSELLFLSVLSIGEIRRGISKQVDAQRRSRIETWLETDLKPWFRDRILAVDTGVAERWGAVAAKADAMGRRAGVIDALLAATALHHDLVFVTRNVADVAHLGVEIFNPWPQAR